MKPTLTISDHAGWYECAEATHPHIRGVMYLVVWPSKATSEGDPGRVALATAVPNGQCQEFEAVEKYTNFVRLVPDNMDEIEQVKQLGWPHHVEVGKMLDDRLKRQFKFLFEKVKHLANIADEGTSRKIMEIVSDMARME